MIGVFRKALFALIVALSFASCGVSKIEDQLTFGAVESVELKGLTGLKIGLEFKNDSRYNLALNEGVVKLNSDGRQVASLTQIGEAVACKKSRGVVTSLWRISGLNPIAMLTLVTRIQSGDVEDLRVEYSARISANGLSKRISQEEIDIREFVNKFAK